MGKEKNLASAFFGILGALTLLFISELPSYFNDTQVTIFLLIPITLFLLAFGLAIKD